MDLKFRRVFIFLLPLIGDLANMILSVLFVLYAESVGFSPYEIGWIIAAYGLSYLIMPALVGRLVDRFSYKTSLTIATLGQMGNAILYLFLIELPLNIIYITIIVGQVVRAAAYSFYWPTLQAFLSESTAHSSKAHAKSIRWFCISWGLGAALGSPIGGYFADVQIFLGFFIVLLVYICAFLIVRVAIPQQRGIHIFETETEASNVHNEYKEHEESPNSDGNLKTAIIPINHSNYASTQMNFNSITILLLLGTLIFAITSKSFLGYFPNYAVIPEGLNWSGTITGQVLFVFGIGQFLAFAVGKYLKNSFKALNFAVMFIGLLILALVWLRSILLVSIILFGAGFFIGRVYYLSLELTMKHESKSKGAKAGMFESIVGLGTGTAPILAGAVAELNLVYPFLFLAIVCGIFFIGFSVVLRRNRIK